MYTETWATLVFWIAAAGVLAVFAGYPLALWLRALVPSPAGAGARPGDGATLPTVTMLVVVRNGEDLIGPKIENALRLDYPPERLDLVVYSDGSTDRTVALARAVAETEPRVRVFAEDEHRGKASALNAAAARAGGEVLVFSDADALLDRESLRELVRPFADAAIGGVCGARGIGADRASMQSAQKRYISLDSAVKELESRRGSITSNDGKLYAIRRDLFRPIAEGVTDDLYSALNVVDSGQRFVFEPRATVSIRTPSRTAAHEVLRRRRIVARSLRGLWLMRRVFRPRRTGLFAAGLFVNKVMRRLLPVLLLLALTSAVVLARRSLFFRAVALLALGVLVLAALGSAPLARRLPRPLSTAATLAHYFVVGNWGSLLGIVDFLRRRTVVRWDPVKGDGSVRR